MRETCIVGKNSPTFTDDPASWSAFKAHFGRTTKSCNFSQDENSARLNRVLKCKANEAMEALLVSPENVGEILYRLEKQFGQPRLVIAHLVEKAKRVPVCRESQPLSISEITNATMSVVVKMRALNFTDDLKSSLLVDGLAQELSPTLKLEWGKYLNCTGCRGLESFFEWLNELREACLVTVMPEESSNQKRKDGYNSTLDSHKKGRSVVC